MTIRQIRQTMLLLLGLMLVLASLAYSSTLQRGYVVVKFAALLIGATALLSLGTYLTAVGRRMRELRDPLVYLLLAEIGVLLFSVATSGQGWVSLLGSVPRLMGAITIACFVVAGVALILAVGERRDRLLLVLRVVAATAAVAGLNAIFEWPAHHEFRPAGLVGNAEFLSNTLLFGALGAVGLIFLERRRGWAIFAIVAAALASIGMTICKTRGAWLGYGVGVAALLLFASPHHVSAEIARRTRGRLLLLVLVTLGVAGLAALWGYGSATRPIEWNLLLPFLPVGGALFIALPWLLWPLPFVRHGVLAILAVLVLLTGISIKTQAHVLPFQAAEALRVTQESARGVVRDDTTRMLSKYWLVGCGIENFRVAFLEFKSERLARADPRVNYRNPHHMLLYEWTANGLPGVLVFLGLIGVGFWWLVLARRRERSTEWGLFTSAILATLVGYTMQNFFNYDVIPSGLHYYLFLAMAVVLRRTAGRDAEAATGEAEAAAAEAAADGAATEAADTAEAADAARPQGKSKSKKLRRGGGASKKEGRRQARRDPKETRKQTRELEARERLLFDRARWLAVGLIGAAALYLLLHHLPAVRDLFRFWASTETMPKPNDGFAFLALTAWAVAWSAAGLLQPRGETRVIFLTVGLVGFGLFYAAYYTIPPLRDFIRGTPTEDLARVRQDVLPGILLLSWAAFWLIVGLSNRALGADPEVAGDDEENLTLGSQNTWALALLLLAFVGTGSWWAGRQLKADYAMFRALAYSRMASSYIGQIQRIQGSMRQVAGIQQQLRRQGQGQNAQRYDQRLQQLRAQQSRLGQRVESVLRDVQRYGRTGANTVGMLGYYHFQYSKALHPFLKVRSALSNGDAILAESLRHARQSVEQNTNPESAWSHLAVVYLAKGQLQNSKKALAQSIKYDPYYYDTHRMMALLHLQDGHIDDAVKEMHRSLDITEGKHFHFAQSALQRLLAARRKGDDAAAEKARAEMWYWLKRGRNFQDQPVQLLLWWAQFENLERFIQFFTALEKSDRATLSRVIDSRAQRPRVLRMSGLEWRIAWGLKQILQGNLTGAIPILSGFRQPRPPTEDPISRAIAVAAKLGRVEPAVAQLLKYGEDAHTKDKRAEAASKRLAEEVLGSESFYLRVLAARLTLLLEHGQDQRARGAATMAARFLEDLSRERLTNLFTRKYRQMYRQVLAAKEQVDAAATLEGRLGHAKRFLRMRKFELALRVAEGAQAKSKDRSAEAQLIRGSALEGLGRLDEALTAYEACIQIAPTGAQADQAKARLAALRSAP